MPGQRVAATRLQRARERGGLFDEKLRSQVSVDVDGRLGTS